MRRFIVVIALVGATALPLSSSLPAGAASNWVTKKVALALNAGGTAQVGTALCLSASSCVVAGSYRDGAARTQAFASMWNGSRWTDREVAGPLNLGGAARVAAVSCASGRFCVAAGSFRDQARRTQAFVTTWNGLRWTDRQLAGALNSGGIAQFSTVSCPTARFCVAGGSARDSTGATQALISTWNGTRWSDGVLAVSLNSGHSAQVLSISCAAATFCVAGGSVKRSAGDTQALVSRWDGTDWNDRLVGTALNTAGAAAIASVSCTSGTLCVAGGSYKDSALHSQALLSSWDGSTWTDTTLAGSLNAGGLALVRTTACFSSLFCVAGGTYKDATKRSRAFVSTWDGAAWDDEKATALPGAQVNAVGCVSASLCVAGGAFKDRAGRLQAFVSTWDGNGWHDERTGGTTGGSANAVACAAAGVCVVGGAYADATRRTQAFAATWKVPAWRDAMVAGALNLGGDAWVNAVSCASLASCAAGGAFTDVTGDSHAFVSLWDGSHWTDTPVAAALNVGGNSEVLAVSCPSPTSCLAGGYFMDDSLTPQAFVTTWDGTSWTDHEVAGALNLGGLAQVTAVSCSAPSSCVAAGAYSDGAGRTQALVSTWDGAAWSDQTVATALNAGGDASVNALSCVSASFCMGGGSYQDHAGGTQAFVTTWDGASWSDHGVAGALNAGGAAQVNALSCVAETSCTAGGTSRSVSGDSAAFVSRWDGAAWVDERIAGSLNSDGPSELTALSCPSAGLCVAGGDFLDGATKSQAFVSTWDGSSWSDQRVAGALNSTGSAAVSAVSCSSATLCVAGGRYSGFGGNQAFVSTWNGAHWSDQQIAGSLNTGGEASVNDVSCTGAGFCSAVGNFWDAALRTNALVSTSR